MRLRRFRGQHIDCPRSDRHWKGPPSHRTQAVGRHHCADKGRSGSPLGRRGTKPRMGTRETRSTPSSRRGAVLRRSASESEDQVSLTAGLGIDIGTALVPLLAPASGSDRSVCLLADSPTISQVLGSECWPDVVKRAPVLLGRDSRGSAGPQVRRPDTR